MRKSVLVIGKGYSEKEAKVDAYTKLKSTYNENVLVYGMTNCEQSKEPKKVNRCTTDDAPTPEGGRKWATKYKVYAKSPIDGSLNFAEEFVTKTEAVKRAKALVLEYHQEFVIKVEKEQTNADAIIATIAPKNAEPGEWKITLDVEVAE